MNLNSVPAFTNISFIFQLIFFLLFITLIITNCLIIPVTRIKYIPLKWFNFLNNLKLLILIIFTVITFSLIYVIYIYNYLYLEVTTNVDSIALTQFVIPLYKCNVTININNLSFIFMLLINLLFPAILILMTYEFNTSWYQHFNYLFWIYFFIFIFIFTTNLLIFYITYELVIGLIFYIMYNTTNSRGGIEAIIFFLGWAVIGSFLVGIAIVYMVVHSQSTTFQIIQNVEFTLNEQYFLFILLFFGFGTKLSIWPFWYWLPRAHVEVSTSVSIFLSCILIKFCFYGLIKTFLAVNGEIVIFPFFFFCGISVFDLTIRLIIQTDLKAITAYGSVLHVNLMIILFLLDTNVISNGLIFYIWGHSYATAGIFFAINLIERNFNTRSTFEISGLYNLNPIVGLIAIFAVITFLEFPLTFFFWGEIWLWIVLLGTLPLTICIIMFLSIFIYILIFFRIWWNIIFGAPNISTLKPTLSVLWDDLWISSYLISIQFILCLQPTLVCWHTCIVRMIKWRFTNIGLLSRNLLNALKEKKAYPQRYEKTLMRWGSGLFWVYFFQCAFGVLISIEYTLAFDTGMPTVGFLWWETSHGSFLIRLHSEFGNFVFFFLYGHVMTKLWTSLSSSDADSYATWVTGSLIFAFTYVAGVTGAIMPCSTLGEVTATIAGSAISSMVYVKFDFLETILVPGMALNEEAIWRSFIIHALVPLLTFLIGLAHMLLLHKNKYSAAGGFKRIATAPRMRETRRWRYTNRYWSRAFGSWFRMALAFMIFRFIGDLFWPKNVPVNYSYSNFDYWPINETIDFVLAIPHWYLRPLMGALVTIPHHYLGFIYIGCFFILVFLVPWLNESNDDDAWGYVDVTDYEMWTTNRWDTLNTIIFTTFLFSAMFSAAIVPTGKYFISIGSMDGLVCGYWILLVYILFLSQLAFYVVRLFFLSFWVINVSTNK